MIDSIDAAIEAAIAATGDRDRAQIVVRHAWLQKHPSPAANSGEFHWYPVGGDRDLRAELVERAHGVEPPVVLWELAPGRVVWAQAFGAQAPFDGRRYIGLAVSIGEGPGVLAGDLLDDLSTPAAAPWTADPDDALAAGIAAGGGNIADATSLARSLITGGPARVADPERCRSTLIDLERVMPSTVTTRVRRGTCLVRATDSPTEPDLPATLAVAAAREPLSPRARGWRVLGELATARGESLDEVAGLLDRPPIEVITDEERAALTARTACPVRTLIEVLHAWGRGWFDLCPTAGSLTERLADAVALSALRNLAAGADPRRAIAEARWYAVLPADRRARLFDTLIVRARSLSAFAEVPHG